MAHVAIEASPDACRGRLYTFVLYTLYFILLYFILLYFILLYFILLYFILYTLYFILYTLYFIFIFYALYLYVEASPDAPHVVIADDPFAALDAKAAHAHRAPAYYLPLTTYY